MALTSADVQSVYALLESALSQEETIRKPAESSLESVSGRSGFCSCLLEIIMRKELDQHSTVRWLAAVYFKNGINRYWRARRDSPSIDIQEKTHLRSKLLEMLREENTQVAIQLAVLIAKIARQDYPKEWPHLFPTLLQKLQSESGDILLTQRIYLTLNQVLKELSTKRLGVDQRNFAEVTGQLFEPCWSHWYGDTQTIIQAITSLLSRGERSVPAENQQSFSFVCERWMLCCKTLRRMMVFGFQSDLKTLQVVPSVQKLVPAYLEAAKAFIDCWYRAHQLQSPLLPFIEKGSLKLMKTICDVQLTHPFSFSADNIMTPCLQFALQQLEQSGSSSEEASGAVFEKFLIHCMILLQSVVKCVAYRQFKAGRVVGGAPTADDMKAALSEKGQAIWKAFLTKEKAIHLCTLLISRFFTLTESDLAEWDSDPESFQLEQAQLQMRDRLRPCAESLFGNLFEHFKEGLAPVAVDLLKQASSRCPPAPAGADVAVTPELLFKDACYDACGVASYDLYDFVDFKTWYFSTLSLELSNSHPNGRILRRRIAWLLGQWVSKIKNDLRKPVYAALIALLGDADMAVKIAACQSLRTLIDDVHFFEEDFVEFVEQTLRLLFLLMTAANELDTKLQVLNLVSLIIDRLGETIVPCADKIMAFLPQVWAQSEGQSLVRIQVILALQRLLISLGPQSPLSYPLLIPILRYSTDISQPDELNMLEDGLQLWLAAVRHAPAVTPDLLQLFPNTVPVISRSFEFLVVCLRLVESYVLLGGFTFMSIHGSSVAQILDSVIGNVNEKGTLATIGVIDLIIQCFPMESAPMMETILQRLLAMVVCSSSTESDMVKANSAFVLARLLLQNTGFFSALFSLPSTAALVNQRGGIVSAGDANNSSLLLKFFDVWMDKMDNISSPSKLKLAALALSVALTLPLPQILDRLELIFSCCTSAILQNEGGESDSAIPLGYDFLSQHGLDESNLGHSESEQNRRKQVLSGDPSITLSVAPFLKQKLEVCSSVHGQAAFNEATSRVHPMVLTKLQQAMQ